LKYCVGALTIFLAAWLCLYSELGVLRGASANDGQIGTSPSKKQLRLPTQISQRKTFAPPPVKDRTLLIMPSADTKPLDPKALKGKKQKQNSSPAKATASQSTPAKPGVWTRGDAAKTSVKESTEETEVAAEEEEAEEDLASAIRSMGGDIVDTIGTGAMTVWVVKFDSNEHFIEAEKRFTNDTRVKSLQRDYLYKNNAFDATAVNDPFFASEWYMDALNVLPAWKRSKGSPNIIGVIDSGTDTLNSDLKGKIYGGFDAVNIKAAQEDVHGHGTMVATTAAAHANNGVGTAGPATLSRIFPVRVGFPNGSVSMSAIIRALDRCGNSGIKIVNLSSNGDPPFTFAHEKFNRVFHDYCEWFHDKKGGLVFNSAGNSGTHDFSRRQPYLIVVTALNEDYSLAGFSTWGRPVWFTAPGTNIYCTGPKGQVVSVSGTSFSSPLTASIAALIWGAKPSLKNTEVEQIMIKTCLQGKRPWSQWFGYGMPDADAAMKMALKQ